MAAAIENPGVRLRAHRPPVVMRSSILAEVALALFLILQFRTFVYFPGMRAVEDAYLVLCVIVFLIVYPVFKAGENWKLSAWELFILCLCVYNPLHEAISANLAFGQPLVYGILAERSRALVLAWLVVFAAVRASMIQLVSISAVLVSLAWCEVIWNTVISLTLDPARFVSTVGLVVVGAHGPEFTFSTDFILYGILFYAIRGMYRGSTSDYLKSVLLYCALNYFSAGNERILSVGLAMVLSYRLGRIRSAVASVKSFVIVGLVAVGIVAAGNIIFPRYTQEKFQLYADAFRVATGRGGSGVVDPSANVRVLDAVIALPSIAQHPWIGVGRISVQWHGGPDGVIMPGFNAGDIGILGMLFTVGILGSAANLSQLYLMKKALDVFPRRELTLHFAVAATMVALLLLVSTTTANFFWDSEFPLFYVGLLFLYKQERLSVVYEVDYERK